MFSRWFWRAISVAAAAMVALVSTQAAAQKFPLKNDLKLEAGATFKVPEWKESRAATPNVAVLEHDATKAGDGFYVLMLTVEDGPKGAGKVDWTKVRDNMVKAAKESKAKLKLKLAGDWTKAAGFVGQRMSGSLVTKAEKKPLTVELVGLIKDGKLITICVLTGKKLADAVELIESVAETTKLGS